MIKYTHVYEMRYNIHKSLL